MTAVSTCPNYGSQAHIAPSTLSQGSLSDITWHQIVQLFPTHLTETLLQCCFTEVHRYSADMDSVYRQRIRSLFGLLTLWWRLMVQPQLEKTSQRTKTDMVWWLNISERTTKPVRVSRGEQRGARVCL